MNAPYLHVSLGLLDYPSPQCLQTVDHQTGVALSGLATNSTVMGDRMLSHAMQLHHTVSSCMYGHNAVCTEKNTACKLAMQQSSNVAKQRNA